MGYLLIVAFPKEPAYEYDKAMDLGEEEKQEETETEIIRTISQVF